MATKRTVHTFGTGENHDQNITLEQDPRFSIEISVNAKGEPSFKIKDYGHNCYNVAERAIDLAQQVCNALGIQRQFYSSGIIATFDEEEVGE